MAWSESVADHRAVQPPTSRWRRTSRQRGARSGQTRRTGASGATPLLARPGCTRWASTHRAGNRLPRRPDQRRPACLPELPCHDPSRLGPALTVDELKQELARPLRTHPLVNSARALMLARNVVRYLHYVACERRIPQLRFWTHGESGRRPAAMGIETSQRRDLDRNLREG